VTQKREAECSVTANTFEAVCSGVGDLSDGVEHRFAELFRLEAAPNLLDGIDVRCVAREWLNGQPVALAGDPVAHLMAAMRRQAVPDEQHWPLLEFDQLGQEVDQQFVVIGARTQFEDEVRSTAIRFVGQCAGERQPFPIEAVAQHWRATGAGAQVARTEGSSETPDSSSKTINRVLAPCPFFNCGQRRLPQRSIAASCVRSHGEPVAATPVQPMPQDVPDARRVVRDTSHTFDHLSRPVAASTDRSDTRWLQRLEQRALHLRELFWTQLRQPSGSSSTAQSVPAGPPHAFANPRQSDGTRELARDSAGPTPCSNKSAPQAAFLLAAKSRRCRTRRSGTQFLVCFTGLFDIGSFAWIATLR